MKFPTEDKLMVIGGIIGTAFAAACVVKNGNFDINAGYWAILPLLTILHFVRKPYVLAKERGRKITK